MHPHVLPMGRGKYRGACCGYIEYFPYPYWLLIDRGLGQGSFIGINI